MLDEPTDSRVDGSTRIVVLVGDCWRAISFVGHFRFLVRCVPPWPTGIDTNKGNQGHNSNGTKCAEDDDRYEPCPKALANLENSSTSHGWPSECLPWKRSGSCRRKRACGRISKLFKERF